MCATTHILWPAGCKTVETSHEIVSSRRRALFFSPFSLFFFQLAHMLRFKKRDDAVPSVVDGVRIKMRLRKINEACVDHNYIARRFCRTLPLVNVQSA